eukprot:Lithocolla_globosa_v1_NODE_256_length_4785_cov_62.877137.p2 type:complete len:240 gc:universal NODE_256_length_4785_cov_62.877137:1103-384(-)
MLRFRETFSNLPFSSCWLNRQVAREEFENFYFPLSKLPSCSACLCFIENQPGFKTPRVFLREKVGKDGNITIQWLKSWCTSVCFNDKCFKKSPLIGFKGSANTEIFQICHTATLYKIYGSFLWKSQRYSSSGGPAGDVVLAFVLVAVGGRAAMLHSAKRNGRQIVWCFQRRNEPGEERILSPHLKLKVRVLEVHISEITLLRPFRVLYSNMKKRIGFNVYADIFSHDGIFKGEYEPRLE